ncbi:MAG: thermonuclease family protein, partial [Patescibacteria group bacterium]
KKISPANIILVIIFIAGSLLIEKLGPDIYQQLQPILFNESDHDISEASSLTNNSENNILFKVISIVDGDTVKIDYFGQTETVRLIGIDTPEEANFGYDQQCYAGEATNQLTELLAGKLVYLVADQTQADRDQYDRLLRYLFLPSGLNVNEEMIKAGLAFEYTYDQPYIYQTEFITSEKLAESQKIGLWAEDTCQGLKR